MPKKKAEKKTALKKEKAQAKTKTASKKKSSKEAKGRLIVSQEEKDEVIGEKKNPNEETEQIDAEMDSSIDEISESQEEVSDYWAQRRNWKRKLFFLFILRIIHYSIF